MTSHPGTLPRLRPLADNLHLWTPTPSTGWGLANCGLVICPRGRSAAWIDSPYDRAMATSFLELGRPLLAEGASIDRVIVTHGNGDHLWGAEVVPDAEIISTRETLGHIDHEPDPAQLHALVQNLDPETVLGWYVKRSFGRFDWKGTEVRRPTTVFTGELELRVGEVPLHLIGLPPAHTAGDLLVHLPQQRTVFTGDVIFSHTDEQPGDHPVHWAGPLANVVSACERALATGAETFVPGHGPVLDREGVHRHIAYLDQVREQAHRLHAAGVPALEAARRIIGEVHRPGMSLPERLVVTVGTEYRHLDGAAGFPDMLLTMGQVAQAAWELEHPGLPAPRSSGQPATDRQG
ncbi:MBL fold metallo-hydrolase [Peterkaempfera griseoplana]|uniref:MBL fold metallo-hydrolase n=1 Tax=Peterkaempfera griseoplana TaxID=66896 RepID=UPI0006E28A7F|nr:MBL fold metallo-hydrolase [Peterkaempfera griseoplana]